MRNYELLVNCCATSVQALYFPWDGKMSTSFCAK